jgi:hypothetical protein
MMSLFEKYPSWFFPGLKSHHADRFPSGKLSQPKSAETKSTIIKDALSLFV